MFHLKVLNTQRNTKLQSFHCYLSYYTAGLSQLHCLKSIKHYENTPIQYTESFFSRVKNENFTRKNLMLLILLLKTYILGTC